ncbi:hypothetical protein ACFE04_014669 [Oxalis oulophora]
MSSDLLLQAGLFLLMLFMFLAMHDIPKNFIAKLRLKSRADLQANRHFVYGAQLLSKARSSPNSRSLAKQAQSQAELAIAINPNDAASHILKSLSLDLQGLKSSALDSLDVALSPPAVASLADSEKADALFKRAELKFGMMSRQRGRVDSVIEDLTQSVELGKGCCNNVKLYCLLGECYKVKKMRHEAMLAYQQALKIDPASALAKAGIDRMN